MEPKSTSAKTRPAGGRGSPGTRSSARAYQPVVRASRWSTLAAYREAAAAQRLERAPAIAQVPVLLEPAVGVERPVDRLHPVVGEDDDGRLLVPALPRGLDQLPARAVDGLVDLHQLVPCPGRVVRRMLRVEAVVAEVARVVGAHEVDAEEAEVGLELHRQATDVRHLANMVDQAARVPLEVLPPALGHRVPRRHEVRVGGEDTLPGDRGNHLRRLGPPVAGHDDAGHRLGRVGERDSDERRAKPRRPERAPERSAAACGRALDAMRAAVGVRREVEDPVPPGVEPGEERGPCRRRHGGDGGAKRAVGALACESRHRRHSPLGDQRADEVVVGAVDPECEDSHAASSSR